MGPHELRAQVPGMHSISDPISDVHVKLLAFSGVVQRLKYQNKSLVDAADSLVSDERRWSEASYIRRFVPSSSKGARDLRVREHQTEEISYPLIRVVGLVLDHCV